MKNQPEQNYKKKKKTKTTEVDAVSMHFTGDNYFHLLVPKVITENKLGIVSLEIENMVRMALWQR